MKRSRLLGVLLTLLLLPSLHAQIETISIPAGTHTLLWRYSKDGSGSAGSDAAWIDGVALPAAVPCITRACSPK